MTDYHDPKYPQWDRIEMSVLARSYVWSPEKHGPNGHGYRRYDWTVVGWDRDNKGRSGTMVVDDDKLTPKLDALTLLGYLWDATGKKPNLRVRDMFDDNDPLVADVEKVLNESR